MERASGEGDVEDRSKSNGGYKVVVWSEQLPLGLAARVVERWPGGAGQREMREVLTRLVHEAWAYDVRLGLPASGREDAHAYAVSASEPCGEAQGLAAQACRAAALVQGRALLSSEALALLGAAGAAGLAGAVAVPWSAAAPALQLAALLGQLRLGGAVAPQPQPRLLRWREALGARPRPRLRCRRCGSGTARMRRTACAACGRACAYCEACLTMGRSRECGLLIHGMPSSSAASTLATGASPASSATAASAVFTASPALSAPVASLAPSATAASAVFTASPAPSAPVASPMPIVSASPATVAPSWGLSPAQKAAAEAALNFMAASHPRQSAPRRFLLWAVTGAGKTEMIFPLIEACLHRRGRALIATPRRDVVLELDPRIRKAFPAATVVTLYGGSEQCWEQGEITLATTHQLFRFHQGFDLVVIDEIDAFPFHNDAMLHFAADNVCKPDGVNILLSATPPAELRRAAKLGRLEHVRVPVRFHRHPLPVPIQCQIPAVRNILGKRTLPRHLLKTLGQSINRGAQLFVFAQQIRDVEPLVERLRLAFPTIVVEGTSSKDPARADKVTRFRDRSIRLLVTTTILERGVTVPKSDVFILDADGKLFDDASLIQMAGRAGRSKDDPAGRVYFYGSSRTRAQQSAIRQIKSMNRIARRSGYLL
ncbi:helicase-related protein [Paenibacillus sp. BC26]|uniref:helicase-related protein n=1 Tax=Paenibacillus sp. BC26 TaxID=1881032 RepID=UPI0021091357|nr:helicase-related protein [Paenibacillus sp. BC26]